MKKYVFENRVYDSFWELNAATPNMVFSPDAPAELLARIGITVIEEPDPQPDALALARSERAAAVDAIVVVVNNMPFDGNETAQGRMARSIAGWPEGRETVQWVLADNSLADVSKAQLQKALELAMEKMRELWVKPYQGTNDV